MKIVNIVAVGKFANVNFKEVQKTASYHRKNFNGLVFRLPNLCTCLLFPNGALTAVGIKQLDSLPEIAQRLTVFLPPTCTVVCEKPLEVCNIVASLSLGCKIDLSQLYATLQKDYLLMYDPEYFPGLKIELTKSNENKLVAIVFHTGKVILTGGKTTFEIEYAQTRLDSLISKVNNTRV